MPLLDSWHSTKIWHDKKPNTIKYNAASCRRRNKKSNCIYTYIPGCVIRLDYIHQFSSIRDGTKATRQPSTSRPLLPRPAVSKLLRSVHACHDRIVTVTTTIPSLIFGSDVALWWRARSLS